MQICNISDKYNINAGENQNVHAEMLITFFFCREVPIDLNCNIFITVYGPFPLSDSEKVIAIAMAFATK